jgi:hypothetical protein
LEVLDILLRTHLLEPVLDLKCHIGKVGLEEGAQGVPVMHGLIQILIFLLKEVG